MIMIKHTSVIKDNIDTDYKSANSRSSTAVGRVTGLTIALDTCLISPVILITDFL